MERLLAAFDVPDAVVGDLLEQRARRSRLWFWTQSIATICVAIWSAVVFDAWLAARVTAAGVVTLSAGVWLSWQLYLWATFAISFPHAMILNPYFVLAWHTYCLPLNLLWCTTAMLAGRSMTRLDPKGRLPLTIVGLVTAIPVLVWCGSGPVAALIRTTNPPALLRFRIGFAFDVLVVFVGMPACAIAGGYGARRPLTTASMKSPMTPATRSDGSTNSTPDR